MAVAPLRNLTGDLEKQHLIEGFTDRLIADLSPLSRALIRLGGQRAALFWKLGAAKLWLEYVIYGSVQQGSPGMLRVNMRISDALTTDYLWAGRNELRLEDLAPMQTEVTRQISRALHRLLIQEAARRASVSADPELGLGECLIRGNAILKGVHRAELSAEAQQWFLVALARDPCNVEALVGLARTCQYLVSNPWWGAIRVPPLRHPIWAAKQSKSHWNRYRSTLLPNGIQGMLCSAAGRLEEAARAFAQALALDNGLAIAHGFGGYNAALLGRPWETLPAIERALQLDPSDRRRHSIWYFFGGFAELLLGHIEAAVALLEKSLKRNPSYGSAQLSLMAALSLIGRHGEAARMAASFCQQYPESPAHAFERLWLSRSPSTVYRAQVYPLFEKICAI